jgi:hypothetical protein
MKKYIGKAFEYIISSGEVRVATCKRIEFNALINKPVFIGISPFGNEVRLTREEISKFRR